jgi:cellulase
MDIWEANARATHLAPHPCNEKGLYLCTGDECGSNGVCDKGGCSQNPYRIDPSYYGPTLKVDTQRPFTVVTQFPADNGTLSAIRRLYVQDGIVIQNVVMNSTGAEAILDKEYCDVNGPAQYSSLGGTAAMGGALSRGMVLAFSVWWDKTGFMEWLDSGASGPCNATEGDPKVIQGIQPDTAVTFSQIKWGEIDSTYLTSQTNSTR